MSHEETKRTDHIFDFRGSWLPSIDPLNIGGKNFSAMANQMPSPDGLEGVPGYTKVTSAVYSSVYTAARSGIQLRQGSGTLSRLLMQAQNAAGTQSAILEVKAASAAEDVPNVKNFESEPLHIDAPGAGLGRFAKWPRNSIAYTNGRETLIYGGDEVPPARFIIGGTPLLDTINNAVDYTDAVTNDLTTPGNVARIGSSIDAATLLYLACDGDQDATDFIDASNTDGGRVVHTVTANGSVKIDQKYKKYGSGAALFASGGYLSAPDSADWHFGAGNFTIDMQTRMNFGSHGLCGQYADAQNFWYARLTNGLVEAGGNSFSVSSVSFHAVSGGTAVAHYVFTFIDPIFENHWYNKWQHIEISRSGATMLCFREGLGPSNTAETTAIGTNAMPDLDAPLTIGRVSNGAYQALGRMDEIRISKGVVRHLTPFTPPSTAYGVSNNLMVLFTNRPIDRAKIYLTSLNTAAGAALSAIYWTGAEWTTLDLTDGSSGLSVNAGVISWPATTGSAKRKLIAGQYRFVYGLVLSAGTAEIYKVTTHPPLQPIQDIWDGTLRPVLEFGHYHAGELYDDTKNVLEETAAGIDADASYVANVGGLTTSEYIDIAVAERAAGFRITMFTRKTHKVNVVVATLRPHYWNGRAYVAPEGIVDGTLDPDDGTKTLNQSGDLSYTVPDLSQEFPKTERGKTAWRYRLIPSDTLHCYGGGNDVWIDKVEAIPAPQLPNNLGYKFPFMLQNRAMLCNRIASGEGNRVDFPLSGSTEGWNGEDSSFGEGKDALFIGGAEELTSACEIFNRLGSSIYAFGLFFKAYETYILNGYDAETFKWYQISDKIGNPAPLSLDTYQITDSRQQDQSSRTVACWLSYQGPFMYFAGDIMPLPGLDCYFDPNDARCINLSAIAAARGWFDPDKPHYNIQFPSGAGQTANNVWLAYDFASKRWYSKAPSCASPYLSAHIGVVDAAGRKYVYGARANGYLMRLEHGTTWDGAAIAQYVETGEILPATIWDLCKNTLFKLMYRPIAEDATLTVTLYRNGESDPNGQVLAQIALKGTGRYLVYNKKLSADAFTGYRLRFSAATSATPRGLQMLAWGIKHSVDHKHDQ